MNRIKYTLIAAAAAVPFAAIALSSAAGPNLVKNGDFSSGVSNWTNYGVAPVAAAGAMQLTNVYQGNGNSYYGAEQCITGIVAGQDYVATADVFVGNDQPARGMAGVYFHFRDDANCNGNNLGGGQMANGYQPDYRGKWVSLKSDLTAPAGAKALEIVTAAVKEPVNYADSVPQPMVALFDNITLKTADVIIVKPTATPTQKPDPQPTAVPTVAPTETPKDQPKDSGDVVAADPQPGSTPQAPNTGDSQPGDTAGNHDTAPSGDDVQVLPAGSGGHTANNSSGTPSGDASPATDAQQQDDGSGLGLGFVLLSAGFVIAGVGLAAVALLRRRNHAAE